MGDKQFTNPTGAFGYTADGDVLGCVFAPFKVAESSSGAITVTRGAIQQITTTGTVFNVDTAQTDLILGVALETVTVPDTDLIAASGQYSGPKTVDVVLYGLAKVLSGGTDLAFGVTLASDASARAIATTTADGNYILGTAIEATGSTAGALVTALIRPCRVEIS
jgi:hypothetical protein